MSSTASHGWLQRALLAALLTILLVTLLPACGGGDFEEEPTEDGQATTQPVKCAPECAK